jgi:hypothetical protein
MIGSSFKNTLTFLRNFKEDDRGSMTVFGLFFFIASGILGAIALDVTSLYAERTHLQIAADQAAHAALYNYAVIGENEADSKAAAIAVVQGTLPASKYGVTIDAANIEFGTYDPILDVFLPNAGYGAARATTAYTDARGNSASAFLFRLIGIDTFEINTSAIFAIDSPTCLKGGFVANGRVDMQNQNEFGAGFCIHSNVQVEIQPNNIFRPGVTVSMPGGRDTVVVPGDKIDDVTGLAEALADDELDLRVFERIENMVHTYSGASGALPYPNVSGDNLGWPSYITNTTVQRLTSNEVSSANLVAGNVYYVECQGNKGLTISSGNGASSAALVTDPAVLPLSTISSEKIRAKNNGSNGGGNSGGGGTSTGTLPVLSQVVIVTPCDVTFGQGSVVHNSRIISTSTSASSFKAPSGLQLGGSQTTTVNGVTTVCETNQGAQLVTKGGMRFAANFSAFGSELFTFGDIKFAATPTKANDFVGASMVANGEIDMASHVNAQVGCGTGGDGDKITASYFRMVR